MFYRFYVFASCNPLGAEHKNSAGVDSFAGGALRGSHHSRAGWKQQAPPMPPSMG
jgi:hypothetical protein